MYTPSPENRKTITLVETIAADGTTIPPAIIVQGKCHMDNWYRELTARRVEVHLSETGYTNTQLSLEYLDHLNRNLPSERPKVLLMDQHGSHMDPLFTLKAIEYQIYPYTFPGHLTHVLQPLDVGVFQPYKHWHRKAVQYAIRSLDYDYTISSFFRDLDDIRTNTFKKSTIQGAFRKAGIYPIDVDIAIQKMKVYQPPEAPKSPELPLDSLQTPRKFAHAESSISQLQEELQQRQLSSPIRGRIETVFKGTRPLLAYGELVQLQLDQLQAKVKAQQKAKTRTRRVIQQSGALTAEGAIKRIAEKEAEEKAKTEKRRHFLIRVTRNRIKNEYKARGVIARRQERIRLQQVKEFSRGKVGVRNSLIPPELLVPIPDPEKAITDEDIELQLQEALITMPEFSGVVIPDMTDEYKGTWDPIDPRLEFESQQDFIGFGNSLDIDADEEVHFCLF
jgi:hypothetical protein